MKLLFTGDINFRGKDNVTFEESEKILTEVLPYAKKSDFVIPNLECPLADKEKHKPIKKSGPNLICAPENICFLKALNTDAVTIANNHIGDFGEGAVKDTLELLEENNILYAGAGKNVKDAYKACRIEKDGVSVSIISVCENEFGMATENTYGSAGYNPKILLKQIREEKAESNYVIVVFHGGNEFNPLPSPDTVDRYKFICDMGADAIIGGHTHCPQGYEIYDGKPIVYSMGNFLFKSRTEKNPNDSWYYGHMAILDIKDGISLETVPYKFDTEATKITVFEGDDSTKMMEYINGLCEIIKNPRLLKLYFMGWAWNHQWCPSLPEVYNNLEKYNASGNFNLVSCEAHLSQLKEVLWTLHNEETEIAEEWAEKIKELEKMPL